MSDYNEVTRELGMVQDALDHALEDLIDAELFAADVRAEVETVLAELVTAHDVGLWCAIYPTERKSLQDRRDMVDFVRNAANLEAHQWVHPLAG